MWPRDKTVKCTIEMIRKKTSDNTMKGAKRHISKWTKKQTSKWKK